jgi:protein associated with RNAse G/E
MTKDKAIEVINFVISKRTDPQIQTVLFDIREYVEDMEVFDYQELMAYIHTKESGKLGGIFMYINKALAFLKQELKSENKRQKKLLKDREKKLERIVGDDNR